MTEIRIKITKRSQLVIRANKQSSIREKLKYNHLNESLILAQDERWRRA